MFEEVIQRVERCCRGRDTPENPGREPNGNLAFPYHSAREGLRIVVKNVQVGFQARDYQPKS